MMRRSSLLVVELIVRFIFWLGWRRTHLNICFLDLAAGLATGFDFLLSAEGASLLINSLRKRPDISRDFAWALVE